MSINLVLWRTFKTGWFQESWQKHAFFWIINIFNHFKKEKVTFFYLSLFFLESDPDTGIQVQLTYLGIVCRKILLVKYRRKAGMGERELSETVGLASLQCEVFILQLSLVWPLATLVEWGTWFPALSGLLHRWAEWSHVPEWALRQWHADAGTYRLFQKAQKCKGQWDMN